MHHPWRRLRDQHPDWTICWSTESVAVDGYTDWHTKTITLDKTLDQAERRSTLAHELEHVERGPYPAGDWWRAREEAICDQEAARKLISLEALLDALRWALSHAEAADELWVDEDLLTVRLKHLHPSERAWLRARLED